MISYLHLGKTQQKSPSQNSARHPVQLGICASRGSEELAKCAKVAPKLDPPQVMTLHGGGYHVIMLMAAIKSDVYPIKI